MIKYLGSVQLHSFQSTLLPLAKSFLSCLIHPSTYVRLEQPRKEYLNLIVIIPTLRSSLLTLKYRRSDGLPSALVLNMVRLSEIVVCQDILELLPRSNGH